MLCNIVLNFFIFILHIIIQLIYNSKIYINNNFIIYCNKKAYTRHLIPNEIQRSRVVALDKVISKLYLLNLDNLFPIIKPLYSDLGRPAKNQQGIIRSLVLMLDQQAYSITNWAAKVASNPLLSDLCDFDDAIHLLKNMNVKAQWCVCL